ncbi:hypothetical protein [Streptomyces griseus]|uniref:hypothetical protein n=1 Tax=Streptomyces griseus TaxID=1911 RepID=UPI0005629D90|nr:hypothetical protein [Streptomyces griseus]
MTIGIVPEAGEGSDFVCDGWRMTRFRHRVTGHQLVVKSARGGDTAALDREFDNTAVLVRLFHRDRVPRQLAHVVARDDTGPTGTRLLLSLRGSRLADWTSPDALHGNQLESAVRDLFTAVAALHRCGLVHGRLDLEHLWWDGNGLQLSGLDTAVRAGRTLPPRPVTAWDPPEFGYGRTAEEQDDVHSAALLAFWMATGQTVPPGSSRSALRDLVDPHEEWIRGLMLRIFSHTGPAQLPPRLPRAREVQEWLEPQPPPGQRLWEERRDRNLEQAQELARKNFAQLRTHQRSVRETRRQREEEAARRERERRDRAAAAATRAAADEAAAARGGPPPRNTGGRRGLRATVLSWLGLDTPPEPGPPPPPRAAPFVPPPSREAEQLTVECPVCLNVLVWDSLRRGQYEDVRSPAVRGEPDEPEPRPARAGGRAARAAQEARSYRTCPGNPTVGPHALPERYPSYGTPVRIGLVGESATGKSHLLAAMIHQVMDAGLAQQYDIEVQPLDQRQYNEYRSRTIDPLMRGRLELHPTPESDVVHFAVGLIVTDLHSGRRHTVVFFDIAGERLQRHGPEVDFLGGLNALLCVVDPTSVPGLGRLGRRRSGQGEDLAVAAVRTRLKAQRNGADSPLLSLPCALVVSKSDKLRHLRLGEAEPWLPGGDEPEDDLTGVERESEDVYTLLAARGGRRALDLVHECEDATLHLASATGTGAVEVRRPDGRTERRFGDGFGQHRVLAPLLSLLAMKGVMTGPRAYLGLHRDVPPGGSRT